MPVERDLARSDYGSTRRSKASERTIFSTLSACTPSAAASASAQMFCPAAWLGAAIRSTPALDLASIATRPALSTRPTNLAGGEKPPQG